METYSVKSSAKKINFFKNRYSSLAVFFLVVQQLIVALSTYWIARLSSDIAERRPFIASLSLFAISLMVVFIPASIAEVFLTLSKWQVMDKYVQAFIVSFRGKTSLRTSEQLKKQNSAFLSSESYLVIDEGHRFLFDWIATILNVIFNIVALGLVLDQKLVIAYICSFILVSIFLKFSHSIAYHKSNFFQTARLNLQHILSSGWENISVGNTYSFDLWEKNYAKSIKSTQKSAANSEGWNSLGSSAGMILAMLPVFFMTGFLFYRNSGERGLLAVLVATLPRQILILQHTHIVVYYATSWAALRAKIDGFLNTLKVEEEPDVNERISFGQIKVFLHADQVSTVPLSVAEVMRMIESQSRGRLTIRGPNGAGKSTVLNRIKELLDGSAFLLPAQSRLQFNDTNDLNLSTGQRLASQLEEIRREVKVSFILLDEWDANLDASVQEQMNSLIDSLAERAVVIEVRHHGI